MQLFFALDKGIISITPGFKPGKREKRENRPPSPPRLVRLGDMSIQGKNHDSDGTT